MYDKGDDDAMKQKSDTKQCWLIMQDAHFWVA